MPLITCEMRWFFEGALPGEVERWFERGKEPAPSAWREDRYLILPGVADMGVKWREGRLEIKGRLAVLGGHAPAADIEGVTERWSKWPYAGKAIEDRFRRCSKNGTITVRKRRSQRHFLLEACAREVARRVVDQRGFALELTRLRIGDDRHWTLGIEAAPDDPPMAADLVGALPQVLEGLPVALPRARSMSYPQWLARPQAGIGRS